MQNPYCFTALQLLQQGNAKFAKGGRSRANVSQKIRFKTAKNGQLPYAVVLTCSDSRVTPEHIFSAGIGQLIVIRNVGNVVSDFELGSIEYAVSSLNVKAIVVLGHSKCGAISAAISGHADGYLQTIVDCIVPALNGETNHAKCVELNLLSSVEKIKQSEIVKRLLDEGRLKIHPGIYDIKTGKVDFLPAFSTTPALKHRSPKFAV